ncbi:uncharacterized protein LOC119687074 [Teleopsis dalmanni]|uniref:uncharacterized protein LOC119687074 n=1 Tax=Teleopsis dalmanni TaxID=139649 RepID=UPI0018CF8F92|nr:uncharacterized protein LOC119687074 [Teleopsis dalmanni]
MYFLGFLVCFANLISTIAYILQHYRLFRAYIACVLTIMISVLFLMYVCLYDYRQNEICKDVLEKEWKVFVEHQDNEFWSKRFQMGFHSYQFLLGCCGLHNKTDYEKENITIHISCYEVIDEERSDEPYEIGCIEAFTSFITYNIGVTRILSWSLMCFIVLSLLFTLNIIAHFE